MHSVALPHLSMSLSWIFLDKVCVAAWHSSSIVSCQQMVHFFSDDNDDWSNIDFWVPRVHPKWYQVKLLFILDAALLAFTSMNLTSGRINSCHQHLLFFRISTNALRRWFSLFWFTPHAEHRGYLQSESSCAIFCAWGVVLQRRHDFQVVSSDYLTSSL